MKTNNKVRLGISVILIIFSSFMQAYLIQSMMKPSNLISMGFTGLSMLLNMIFKLINIDIPIAYFIVMLNLPVALLCAKWISKKFTILSVMQIVFTSVFLQTFHFKPFFNNVFLDITVGAFLYGIMIVVALKAGGSTGGTDFIALFVSNKIQKAIWEYVFVFNVILLIVLGYIFDWERAGYSVVFQYVTTKTISTFYHRYSRITLQIITKKPDEVVEAYVKSIYRGITKTEGYGGYTNVKLGILYTVVSTYQVNDIVKIIKSIDEEAIINSFKTENFYGNFYLTED